VEQQVRRTVTSKERDVILKEIDFDKALREFDMTPFNERIIIIPLEIEQTGAIWVPENSREMATNEGIVIACGNLVQLVEIGDHIYHGQYSGFTFRRGGQKLRCIKEMDLIAKVRVEDKGNGRRED